MAHDEKNFENRVKKFLKDEGCWYLKTWGGGMQRSGIPDLLICCNGRFVGVELKSDVGRPSPLQKYEIEQIQTSNGIALVLRPDGFDAFKKMIGGLKNGTV